MTQTPPANDTGQILREIDSLDRAVYRAIAQTATPTLDHDLRSLSRAADHSVLWLSIAGALALVPGRPRRAALLGAASIGVASVSVNVIAKMLLGRPRPDRSTAAVPIARLVRMPHSTSFPSGHSASAFAFASAVGTQLPRLALPLQLLAAAVAYSRVHTGVHYPSDTIVGASIGMASAAATAGLGRHLAAATRSA
jgi:membrane-associated phospholipid phosphatase